MPKKKLRFLMVLYYRNIVTLCTLMLGLILALPAYALAKTTVESLAELSIEQLMSIEVSSTSFFDIPPEKAPGAIYLISREMIERSYASSLSDFLEYYIPGVHISGNYSSGALYSSRGIASSSNSTTLFMLDGQSMNVSNGAGINTNLDLPLLGYVERVEVLKGPCSIIHGSGSINGFINVIQKSGADNPGGFVNTEAAFPSGLVKAETGYGYVSKKAGDLFFYAGMVHSDGIEQDNIKFDSFPQANTRFSINWKKNNVKVSAFVQDEVMDSSLKFRQDSHNYSEVSMRNAAILPEIDIHLTDTEMLKLNLPVQYFEYNADYLSSDEDNLDSEWQIKPKLLFKTTRFADHRIAMGASVFMKGFHADNIIVDSNAENSKSFEADVKWLETGIFMEDNFQMSRDITLFAGLRYDGIHTDSFELTGESGELEYDGNSMNMFTPRLGITWQFHENQLVKFIYQEGYHYPDYINFLTYGDINEGITAEKVKSYEAGYHLNLMEKQCLLTFNLYYNIYEDTVNYVPDEGMDTSDNENNSEQTEQVKRVTTGEFASMGFETGLRFTPDDVTWLDISYAFSRPHNTGDSPFFTKLVDDAGNSWKAYPEHTIKCNLTRSFLDEKLDLSLGCLFNGSVTTSDSKDSDADPFDHNRFIVNAGLRYQITPNFSVSIKGKNIFNNNVPATGYYYQSLKNKETSLEEPVYTIGLRWTF